MNITPVQKKWIAWILVALVIFGVNTYLGVSYPIPEPPAEAIVELGTTHFTDLEAEDITATDDLTVTDDAAVGGDLGVTGDLGLIGDFAAAGKNTLDLVIFDHTALTATTTTITPTHTFYSLDTAAAVTITLAASGTEGQLLVLINDDANALVIADTNLVSADGNAITLSNADDTAIFIYQDSKWHELASLDGS